MAIPSRQRTLLDVSRRLSQATDDFFADLGQVFLNLWEALCCIATGRVDWGKAIQQTAIIGFDSLGVSLLICLISGSVLALQTADKFAMTGADAYVGGLVALAIVREIAPIFASLAVGARAGTAIAAELANMKVTEQVDALRMMRISPVRYLMVPRALACVVSLPILTFLGAFVGILGGMVVARTVSGLHYSLYLESVWLNLGRYDIQVSLAKAAIFGLILAAISCTIGLNTRGGARDVGRSTTRAVVWIAIAIIITDFFLTWIFFGTTFERNF